MSAARTEAACLSAAIIQGAWKPSLELLARSAVAHARNRRQHGIPDDEYARRDAAALDARDRLLEQLYIETGIGKQLWSDLVQEAVI